MTQASTRVRMMGLQPLIDRAAPPPSGRLARITPAGVSGPSCVAGGGSPMRCRLPPRVPRLQPHVLQAAAPCVAGGRLARSDGQDRRQVPVVGSQAAGSPAGPAVLQTTPPSPGRCPGSAPCAFPGRGWRLWAARHSRELRSAHWAPSHCPRVLEPAASTVAELLTCWPLPGPPGLGHRLQPTLRPPRAQVRAARRARKRPAESTDR